MNWNIFADNLIVHEALHFIIALLISFFIYRKYKSFKLVVSVFLVTFLVDVDHFFEGFAVYGLDIKKVIFNFHGNYFLTSGLMILLFHTWEALPVILWLGKKYNHWPLALSIVLALTGHFLVDNLVYTALNGLSVLEYSIIFRFINKFDYWKLCGNCLK